MASLAAARNTNAGHTTLPLKASIFYATVDVERAGVSEGAVGVKRLGNRLAVIVIAGGHAAGANAVNSVMPLDAFAADFAVAIERTAPRRGGAARNPKCGSNTHMATSPSQPHCFSPELEFPL
jgi:hypothetical protein